MNIVAIMQLRNSQQTCLKDLLSGFHWNLFLDKTQKVVRQILIHKDGFVRDAIRRQSEVCMFAKSGSYDFIEV